MEGGLQPAWGFSPALYPDTLIPPAFELGV